MGLLLSESEAWKMRRKRRGEMADVSCDRWVWVTGRAGGPEGCRGPP